MTLTAIIRGDTRVYPITIEQVSGTLLDLTGGTMFFTMKEQSDDLDVAAVIAKTVICSGTTASILLTHDDTKDLEERTYVCDFQFVSANSSFVATGLASVKVIKDVTLRVVVV